MTFIEMVRAVRSRVGMQGTTPSSISGAVGAEIDIVNSVRDAWIDIQNSRDDWKWQRSTKNFSTVANTYAYAVTDILPVVYGTFDRWREQSTYYLDSNSKRRKLRYIDYDIYMQNNRDTDTPSKPRLFAIRPWDNAILINPPDDVYTMQIDFQKSLQALESDATVPNMPAHFHMLIVYAAIEKYAVTLGSPEIYNHYAQEHVKLWGSLTRSQLPESKFKQSGGIA